MNIHTHTHTHTHTDTHTHIHTHLPTTTNYTSLPTGLWTINLYKISLTLLQLSMRLVSNHILLKISRTGSPRRKLRWEGDREIRIWQWCAYEQENQQTNDNVLDSVLTMTVWLNYELKMLHNLMRGRQRETTKDRYWQRDRQTDRHACGQTDREDQ